MADNTSGFGAAFRKWENSVEDKAKSAGDTLKKDYEQTKADIKNVTGKAESSVKDKEDMDTDFDVVER